MKSSCFLLSFDLLSCDVFPSLNPNKTKSPLSCLSPTSDARSRQQAAGSKRHCVTYQPGALLGGTLRTPAVNFLQSRRPETCLKMPALPCPIGGKISSLFLWEHKIDTHSRDKTDLSTKTSSFISINEHPVFGLG